MLDHYDVVQAADNNFSILLNCLRDTLPPLSPA